METGLNGFESIVGRSNGISARFEAESGSRLLHELLHEPPVANRPQLKQGQAGRERDIGREPIVQRSRAAFYNPQRHPSSRQLRLRQAA
jgi:hypothetical protein